MLAFSLECDAASARPNYIFSRGDCVFLEIFDNQCPTIKGVEAMFCY